jgi:hypothetical protein
VYGPRHQFLSGPAFAAYEHRGFGRGHPRQETVNPFHRGAFTDHVVLKINLRRQPLIFLLQPLQPPCVFQRHRGDARNGGYKFEMVSIKSGARTGGVQVDATQYFFRHGQGHTATSAP